MAAGPPDRCDRLIKIENIMANKNEEFLKRLLATFRDEAGEHLQAMSADLLALEKSAAGAKHAEIIEHIFREAHSLKGAARAVNLTEIESVCQSLESVFAALKNGQLEISPPLSDLLQEAIDGLDTLLSEQRDAAGRAAVEALNRRLGSALRGKMDSPQEPASKVRETEDFPAPVVAVPEERATENVDQKTVAIGPSETVRIATAKLGAAIRQAEELLVPKLAAEQRYKELRETGITLAAWQKQRAGIQTVIRSIERSIGKTGKVSAVDGEIGVGRLLKYLEQEAGFAKAIGSRIAGIEKSMGHDYRSLSGTVDDLLQNMREILMMPLDSLFETFPRMIREIARDQKKEIELVMRGGEIEIDRRVIEELRVPLTHLLRNCIDHGIEQPALRAKKQKSSSGTITLTVSQTDSGKAEIVIADDGAGINVEQLKTVARERGMISAEGADKLGEQEALALIFQSGISTSPIVTDLSGRGLGLAIVREKIDRLGGTIEIESRPDHGAIFHIVVPLTLATFRGVLARIGDRLFVVPLRNVERVLRIDSKDVRTVENRETIQHDEQAVALVYLGDVLELPRNEDKNGADASVSVMVLGNGTSRIAFRVDEILGEQEVMVKMLGQQLERVRNVSGACILGTGQVVPVLNSHDLMKSAVQQAGGVPHHAAAKPSGKRQHSILVVEDSITSRALLKNILESAGYRVTTAVDGIDAYTTLKSEAFDLVVSDVEMPRMDGFDLTVKIRADKQLSELPVVLVTSLAAREHQERGIDVGANAYIVKSSFEQGNLLEIIGRMI